MSYLTDAYVEFVALADSEQQLAFACAHPVLLWKKSILALAAAVPAGRQDLQKQVALLDHLRVYALRDNSKYLLGQGPLEQLEGRATRGELSIERACELAGQPDITCQMAPAYVTAVSSACFRSAEAKTWRRALRLIELLLAATPYEVASLESESLDSWWIAREDFLQLARIVFTHVPDGRVFQLALAVGAELLERRSDESRLNDVHYLLGILHLDPFGMTARSHKNYKNRVEEWRHRLVVELGEAAASGHRKRYPVPAPSDALATAEKHLRIAVELRQGVTRGSALKALLQTLLNRRLLFEAEIDQQEFRALSFEALELLQGPEYQNMQAEIRGFSEALDLDPLAESDSISWSDAGQPAYDSASSSVRLLIAGRDQDPFRGFERLHADRERFAKESYDRRVGYFSHLLNLLGRAASGFDPTDPELISKLDAKVESGVWTAQQADLALLGVALLTTSSDQELLGLQLAELAFQRQGSRATEYGDVHYYLGASLLYGAAVNFYHSGAFGDAVMHYGSACERFLSLGLAGNAADSLNKLADAAGQPDEDMLVTVIATLASSALKAEIALPGAAADALQRAYRHATRSMGDEYSIEAYWPLLQLAKGYAFSRSLGQATGPTWRDDPDAVNLLQRANELEASQPNLEDTFESKVGPELLLTAYYRMETPRSGANESEILVNLRHAFYSRSVSERIRLSQQKTQDLLNDQWVRSRLDERTVLLDYYVGEQRDAQLALNLTVATRDSVQGFRRLLGTKWRNQVVQDGPRTLVFDVMAPFVADLREDVQRDPGVRPLHRNAVEI